ncbi:pseudouridine synthase [Flammeovirga kamogawensis]|uniref:tRNA pseudouridine synthase C n=1 Tax=Flammeovirga kamogawensis TaxID=373891 RepID=A0ABX8GX54_9BACT|nr:pseudouridine synthase [Flammeovirga kamogawensis]MBB6460824.1 tRNA pseudouridine65 synthase [Flammeovirga kamogawensis]QWG08175.1 pseudouridylate synthase [Flammeovirga kamogawensis]TRX69978.1 tRNA pseudouridine(65) synthase TruC [Flammeovirga kamogawensis]
MLEILFQDEHYIAINKPSGLLVHPSELTGNEGDFAIFQLRDQIGKYIYPCHRLDRATSGVLIFAFSSDATAQFQKLNNEDGEVEKRYLSLVRGHLLEEKLLTNHIKNRYDKVYKSAKTLIKPIQNVELDIPVGPYPTSRYSLVESRPYTGRTHQIRLHLRGENHPIIGDRRYGDHRHNNMMLEKFKLDRLWLHASSYSFVHPYTKKMVCVKSSLPQDFSQILNLIGINYE